MLAYWILAEVFHQGREMEDRPRNRPQLPYLSPSSTADSHSHGWTSGITCQSARVTKNIGEVIGVASD